MKNILPALLLALLASCSILPKKDSVADRKAELEKTTKDLQVPTAEDTFKEAADDAMQKGDYIKAESNYTQLLHASPDNKEYQYNFAETHRRMGDCKTALTIYNKLLEKDSNNLDYQESKGLCLVAQTEFEKAGPILTHIIETDPKRWKSINGAGLIFAANKKYKEANQYFDLAADLSDRNPTVLNNQGLVRALVGNYDDAIKVLKEASMKSDEGSNQKRQVDLNLAMVYGITKKMDMAERTARPHLTEPQLYNNLGVYAELAKDSDLARVYLDKALMKTPVFYDRAWDNLENLKN